MKALMLYSPGDLRLVELGDPEPRGEWVRIKVERVGICGTDKAFYMGSYKLLKQPLIPGHEIAGRIDMVGEQVSRDLIGRRVTTEINIHCRKCWYCHHGMPTHCPHRETIGITRDGGMAEYVLTRSDLIHLADDLDPGLLALVEPLAAVIEMNEMEEIPREANIAVLGLGTIGLLSIAYLKTFNPRLLIGVARKDTPKSGLALSLGARKVVSFNEAVQVSLAETPEGQGFDYVVEATGTPQGLDMALDLVRPRGVVAGKSTHGSPVTFDYTKLIVKEARLIGSRCGPFDKALSFVRKYGSDLSRLITRVYPLESGVEAFEASFDRKSVKIQLEP
ncbi:MAG: alcohol dehydrogenase catalytic domain-containing protein [Desulfurococcales archaeon]|nr:alcohol dehydrogenase catalytic domain-containing protein [Desulfurococcales archaeon]